MKNNHYNRHDSTKFRLHRHSSFLRILCLIAAAIILTSGLTGCNGIILDLKGLYKQSSIYLNAVNPQSRILTTAEAKTYDGKSLYCTADDYVALREKASSSSTELARIPHGGKMTYLNKQTGHWYYVQYNSKKGYVYDKYVTFDQGAVDADKSSGSSNTLYCTADDFVALREKANAKSKELARIPHGGKMENLNKKTGKWYYVKYGTKKGYVYSDYVSSKSPNASSSSSSSSGKSSSSGSKSGNNTSGKSGGSSGGYYGSYSSDYSSSVKKLRTCKVCSGTGKVVCDSCHGTGKFKHTHHAPGLTDSPKTYYTYTTCVRCNGKKKIKCTVCGGDGRY